MQKVVEIVGRGGNPEFFHDLGLVALYRFLQRCACAVLRLPGVDLRYPAARICTGPQQKRHPPRVAMAGVVAKGHVGLRLQLRRLAAQAHVGTECGAISRARGEGKG
jgi:hypothetical protein